MPESCRCKVYCSKLETTYGGGVQVTCRPVTDDGNPENKAFHATTPGGEFTMQLSPAAAKTLGMFELGKKFYVDFRPVPVAQP